MVNLVLAEFLATEQNSIAGTWYNSEGRCTLINKNNQFYPLPWQSVYNLRADTEKKRKKERKKERKRERKEKNNKC